MDGGLVVAPVTRERPLVCLAWALFPIFGKGRYAPDWQVTDTKNMRALEVYDRTGFRLENLQGLHHMLKFADESIVSNRVRGFDPR